MSKPPDYGIIYNWDGAPHGYSPVPQTREHLLEKMYAPLENTQVGAHFWCTGDHTSHWKSSALEMIGDSGRRTYENAHAYIFSENVLQMLERGEDPQAEAIRRGRELGLHVYASIRMNDNHFNGAQIEEIPTLQHTSLTKMRREHPQWLLGTKTSDWFALSWNLEVHEVREHRFAHIKELCEMYDWDGVELDWQRHAFHLPDDFGYRLRYGITELARAVRRLTNELAEKRGRPFYVAARVSGTLEGCLHIGYDIPVWINEGLIDILIPSGGSGTDPDVEVEQFVDLCRPANIPVYPAMYGSLPDPHIGPEDSYTRHVMRTRAIAARYHAKGGTGVYVFNYHANRESRRELLTQMGSPETLRKRDKIYSTTYRNLRKAGPWRNAEKYDRMRGTTPVALKKTITGDGPEITLDVIDDVTVDATNSIELRVRIQEWVWGDQIRVMWDGAELRNATTDYDLSDPLSDVSADIMFSFTLSLDQVASGPHRIKVILAERHTQVISDPVLTHVDLVIRY